MTTTTNDYGISNYKSSDINGNCKAMFLITSTTIQGNDKCISNGYSKMVMLLISTKAKR